ncbi:MAG: Abi family protein [Bacteroidales bacterium]|nr:Abi family protein [Bacteroidales bacterium]
MNYSDIEKAFSPARLKIYLDACGDNHSTAMVLYRHNNKLCQKFYGTLAIFEVVLRNAINEHFKSYFADPDWIRHQLVPGGMLENNPQRPAVEKIINQLDKTGRYSNDRLVSSVSFGFWTHLFSRRPFALGGQSILQIFPSRTKGLGQRAIYNELQQIKTFRNRIVHHEAICFNDGKEKSTAPARHTYSLIIKYIQFLNYHENQLFFGFNVLPVNILNKIDTLKTDSL